MEGAKGVMDVNEIVNAGESVTAIRFGAADYMRDLTISYPFSTLDSQTTIKETFNYWFFTNSLKFLRRIKDSV
jgi:citrate lyase beta subunit